MNLTIVSTYSDGGTYSNADAQQSASREAARLRFLARLIGRTSRTLLAADLHAKALTIETGEDRAVVLGAELRGGL